MQICSTDRVFLPGSCYNWFWKKPSHVQFNCKVIIMTRLWPLPSLHVKGIKKGKKRKKRQNKAVLIPACQDISSCWHIKEEQHNVLSLYLNITSISQDASPLQLLILSKKMTGWGSCSTMRMWQQLHQTDPLAKTAYLTSGLLSKRTSPNGDINHANRHQNIPIGTFICSVQ